jgi:hypothetical protein
MAAVPSFILKKLYVANSLRNTDEGCQLQIKNTLAPATLTGMGPVRVDGVPYPQKDVVLMRGNERLAATDAGSARPMSFDINVVITIIVKNVKLAAGEHRIGLDVTSREAGRLKVEIVDKLNA